MTTAAPDASSTTDVAATSSAEVVVSGAVVKAADRLGLSSRELSRIVGSSEATVSRLRSGAYLLKRSAKEFELAVLLTRLYRGLDAITGGDDTVSSAWMRNENTALHGKPVELIQDVMGLVNVVRYLDARRAPI